MSNRCVVIRAVVNCASDSWVTGQNRLRKLLPQYLGAAADLHFYTNQLPPDCPPHRLLGWFGGNHREQVPYAFKAFALKEASRDADLLLWCDACMVPVRDMTPLWERIERDGYWMGRNGFSNYEWTADSTYPDLFAPEIENGAEYLGAGLRELNRTIPHVVATAFGINVRHPKGKAFLDGYYRLASETRAFIGPWWNTAYKDGYPPNDRRVGVCGPNDVRGHRHDQTAASVIAWRLGFELTAPPEVFSYPDSVSEQTIIVAQGDYTQ